jgi:hypothetical protein
MYNMGADHMVLGCACATAKFSLDPDAVYALTYRSVGRSIFNAYKTVKAK